MKSNKEIFEELAKQYTHEELAESFLINEELNPDKQKEENEAFRKLRLAQLEKMSPQELLLGKLLQMKYLMQDYFSSGKFDPQFSFANQLRKYIKVSNRSSKEIASNLQMHPTKLSRILNEKEKPNIELMLRLEEHSSGELPAHYWWKLFSIQLENVIKTDLKKKMGEAQKVSQRLEFR